MTVPYSFASRTTAIPLSELDSNFNTAITLGNTAIQLGNTVTTLNNMTLANVTISSGTINASYSTANAVVYTNSSNVATTSTAIQFDGSNLGLGVTPSAWGMTALQVTGRAFLAGNGNTADLGNNCYKDGSGNWKYIGSVGASFLEQYAGAYIWYNSGSSSGTAGSTFSPVTAMTLDASGYLLVGYTSSNGAYKLQVNSQIFATSSTIATSDGRYKENVLPLSGALGDVCALNPVQFSWKKHPVHAFDTTTPTVGFIAQEVEQVLSEKPYLNSIIKRNECVISPEEKDKDGNVTAQAVTEEFLGIAEGNMIALLTAAIKELKAELDATKAEVSELKGA